MSLGLHRAYVPYQWYIPRWSFSYGRRGLYVCYDHHDSRCTSVPVTLQPIANPAMVRTPSFGFPWGWTVLILAQADHRYILFCEGQQRFDRQSARNFTYTVTVFDPAMARQVIVPMMLLLD